MIARLVRRILVATSLVLAAGVHAQTNDEANASLRFDFSNPGARSLGMGGTFVAVADDATAALTNPAGLGLIIRPEVSFEGRVVDATDEFVLRGGQRAPAGVSLGRDEQGNPIGDPTGRGPDRIGGLVFADVDQDAQGQLAFFSYVHPFHVRDRDRLEGRRRVAALGIYRHETANLDQAFQSEGAFFWETCGGSVQCPTGGDVVRSRHRPVESQTDLEIASYGLSAAFPFLIDDQGQPRVSLGVGVTYHDFELISQSNRLTVGKFDEVRLGLDPIGSSTTQYGSDEDWTANVGVTVKAGDHVTLGATYRQGPEFDVLASTRIVADEATFPDAGFPGPRASAAVQAVYGGFDYRSGIVLPGRLPTNNSANGRTDLPLNEEFFPTTFQVPDVYGFGVAVTFPTPSGTYIAAFEYNRIQYDDLEDLADLFQVLAFDGTEPTPGSGVRSSRNNFEVDAADVLRLGFEYRSRQSSFGQFAFRTGAWFDPDHDIRYVTGTNEDRKVHFFEGDDEIHGSLGVGWKAANDRVELGLAVDGSESITTGSLYTRIGFGR